MNGSMKSRWNPRYRAKSTYYSTYSPIVLRLPEIIHTMFRISILPHTIISFSVPLISQLILHLVFTILSLWPSNTFLPTYLAANPCPNIILWLCNKSFILMEKIDNCSLSISKEKNEMNQNLWPITEHVAIIC